MSAPRLAIAIAMALAAGLRLHGLTRHSLWLDEANSVAIAGRGLGALPASLAHDSSPPLYYGLLHGWIALFGEGEAAVRLLSVLFGILMVPATALLARRLGGSAAAAAAAFLTAATPMAVQFSQEARMYTLLPLLAVLAAERLVAYLSDGRRTALLTHALLLAAACYTHNWGLLLLPGAALAVLAGAPERLRGWAVGALLALVLYAPWLPVVGAQVRSPSYLFVGMVQAAPAWQLPLLSLLLFAGGVGTTGGEARSLLPGAAAWLAAAAWAALCAWSLRSLAHRRINAAMILFAAVPLALAAIYSAAVRPVYLLGRYEIMVLPVLLAVLAGPAAGAAPRRGRIALVAAWVAGLATLSLAYSGSVQRRFPEKEMALRLAPELREGDRVVFCGLYRAATEYYLRRSGAVFEAASFPPDAARHLGWFHDRLYSPDDPGLAAAARAECPRPGARVWIVLTGVRTCGRLLDELSRCGRLSSPFAPSGVPADRILLALPPGEAPDPGPARRVVP